MDGCEVVIVALVVSGCDGAKVLEFVEEPLDEIAHTACSLLEDEVLIVPGDKAAPTASRILRRFR